MSIEKQKEKPIEEFPPEDQIKEAIREVQEAMLESMSAGKAEVDAKIRKNKARYKLLKAQERLSNLYYYLM